MFTNSNWSKAIRARFRAAALEGKHFWWWLLITFTIIGVTFYFPQSLLPRPANLSDRTRWAGMIFQIAGVYCVISGLNDSKVFFGQAGIVASAWAWIISWAHIFDRPRIVQGGVTMNMPAASINFKVGTVSVNPTTETRLAELETSVAKLQLEVPKAITDLRFLALQSISREREERMAALVEAEGKLRTVMTGGVAFQAAGAVYIFVGIVFTSIPDEFAKFIGAG